MTTRPMDDLANALLVAAPDLDRTGRAIVHALYRLLVRGIPVADATIAAEIGESIDDVRSLLASWPGVFRDDEDRIIGFWGLSIPEMPHQLDIDGVRLHAWCAWDTLFLPGILGVNASVRSIDPDSGETVSLTVTPDKVAQRSHEQMVVSFLTPTHRFDGDVMINFCHYIHFFTDPDSAAYWLSVHNQTFPLELDDAFELGRRWNVARGL